MLGRYKIGANKINSVVFICWVSLALKSDDHVPSMQTNQFAGKRHVQFFLSSCLTRRRCSTSVCFWFSCSTFCCNVALFCHSGVCISRSETQTLQCYVSALCDTVFTPCFSLLLVSWKETVRFRA